MSSYSLYQFIGTRFGDPVSSIALSRCSFVMGTMMGKTVFYYLPHKKTFTIIKDESTMENISDISFINEGVFLVGMGDEAVMKFTYNLKEPSVKPDGEKINNYPGEKEHKKACDNSYVMLSKNYMLKIMLHRPYDANITIETINAEYITKDFSAEVSHASGKKLNAVEQSIEMTNYAVPLDFNAPLFVWVEYHDDVKRFFCVANVLTNDKESQYRFELNKQFGHISHCKLLSDKCVFIVRKLNVCEVRKLDEAFTVIKSFVHIGDEVYAVDVGYRCAVSANTETNENDNCGDGDANVNTNTNDEAKDQQEGNTVNGSQSNNNNNVQLYHHTNMHSEKVILDNEDDLYNKVQCSSNNIVVNKEMCNLTTHANATRNARVNGDNNSSNNNEIGDAQVVVVGSGQKNKNNNNTMIGETDEEKNEDESEVHAYDVVITLLDIDGNVNVYENGHIRVEFNLYDLEDIDKEHKDKQFFAMGYSYYMKYNGEFFAISSDHGCYIIQRKKKEGMTQ